MAVGFIWPFTFFDYFATDLPSPPEAGKDGFMFCLGESQEGFELEMGSELIVLVNAATDRSMPFI
jgi:hypothetical protein